MTIETKDDTHQCSKCGCVESNPFWVADDICETCRLESQFMLFEVQYKGRYWKLFTELDDNDYHITCFGPTILWGTKYPHFLSLFDVLQAELHTVQNTLRNLDQANKSSKKFFEYLENKLKTKIENDRRPSKKKG